MGEKVLVRFPQQSRDTLLRPAEVIARKGDTLRVKVENELCVREIKASDTMPMAQAFGRPGQFGQASSMPVQCFPTAPNAIGNR